MSIKNELFSIRKLFTSKSIQKKIDYLNDSNSNIDDQTREFFIHLMENNQSRNIWYKISLIDFAGRYKMKDAQLLNRFIMDVISSNNYYLKLTILDYICDTYPLYINDRIEYPLIEKILYNKSDRYIVKNQAIICLMMIYPERVGYSELLKRSLSKTTDYRGHIRIYNTIVNYDLMKNSLLKSDITEMIRITHSCDFFKSKSVQEVLQRINDYINLKK